MNKTLRLLLVVIALSAPGVSFAQLYPLFGPSNGIMKGSTSSPQTSSATSTDVISLFSACAGSQYLGADGNCHSALSNPIVAPFGTTPYFSLAPSGTSSSAPWNCNFDSTGNMTCDFAALGPTLSYGTHGNTGGITFQSGAGSSNALKSDSSGNWEVIASGGGSFGGEQFVVNSPAGNFSSSFGVTQNNDFAHGVAFISTQSTAGTTPYTAIFGSSMPRTGGGETIFDNTGGADFGFRSSFISSSVDFLHFDGSSGAISTTTPFNANLFSLNTTGATHNGTYQIGIDTNGNSAVTATNSTNSAALNLSPQNGITIGSPTGGAQGAGSINATALYINGAPVGTSTGAVSSVAFLDASTTPIFGITGSPVTSAGTLTETLKTQSANTGLWGPTSGGLAQPTFRSMVTADFPASGVTAGSCTYCSVTFDATGRATAQSSGTAPASGANPSASVGLSAVNGSASTFMRSDAAPALSQSISPTWTGNHTFAPASGTGITITSAPSSYSEIITDSGNGISFRNATNTTGYDIGLLGGTGSADSYINNRANAGLHLATDNANRIDISAAGNVTVNAPSTGLAVVGTGTIASQGAYLFPGVSNSSAFLATQQTSPGVAQLGLVNAVNATDEKFWAFSAGTGSLGILTANDADTAAKNALIFTRSGTTVSTITLGNVTDNPAVTVDGTLNSTGNLTQGGTHVCLATGTNCPATGATVNSAYAEISSSCTVGSPSKSTSGCTSGGTGIFQVSVTGFTSTPMCVASTGHAFVQYTQGSSSSTVVTFATYDATGANANEAFGFICMQ